MAIAWPPPPGSGGSSGTCGAVAAAGRGQRNVRPIAAARGEAAEAVVGEGARRAAPGRAVAPLDQAADVIDELRLAGHDLVEQVARLGGERLRRLVLGVVVELRAGEIAGDGEQERILARRQRQVVDDADAAVDLRARVREHAIDAIDVIAAFGEIGDLVDAEALFQVGAAGVHLARRVNADLIPRAFRRDKPPKPVALGPRDIGQARGPAQRAKPCGAPLCRPHLRRGPAQARMAARMARVRAVSGAGASAGGAA